MLEGIQAKIQSMRRQPSTSLVHFSNPPSENSPPPSLFGDHANAEYEHIDVPMASPSHLQKACEEFSNGDAHPQTNTGIDLQMDLNDHPPVQHSLEIIHIEGSDGEIKKETAEAPVEDMVEENVQ